VTKLSSRVEHLRLALGETEFDQSVATGSTMEPAEAAHYAREQIANLRLTAAVTRSP
jgi:hypothetical protein